MYTALLVVEINCDKAVALREVLQNPLGHPAIMALIFVIAVDPTFSGQALNAAVTGDFVNAREAGHTAPNLVRAHDDWLLLAAAASRCSRWRFMATSLSREAISHAGSFGEGSVKTSGCDFGFVIMSYH
jgi:hypothetical protein